jgi:hypothetical protein
MSPFDIKSVVFHFDDFNYGRQSQPGRYCACEILIANPIDWLHAACLEYILFSRSTVQKLENNMMNIVCQSCKQ